MRWFILDSDLVGNGFTALCYEDDSLEECIHFSNRVLANEYGDKWMHPETRCAD